jgi:SAM-dependent methyltransferase
MNFEPKHEGWDAYWSPDVQGAHRLYSVLASFYRRIFICGRLAHWLRKSFNDGASLLHAGCGGGEVDALVSKRYRITGLDISPNALRLYERHNPHAVGTIHADLLRLDLGGVLYDGAYNLGVLEHFERADIVLILQNMMKAVRPDGKLVIFWPLANAPSVKLLGAWHRALNRGSRGAIQLHPRELTLIQCRAQVEGIVEAAGFKLYSYEVTPRDLFIQAVVVIGTRSRQSDSGVATR